MKIRNGKVQLNLLVSPQCVAQLCEFAKKIGYKRNQALEIAIVRALAIELDSIRPVHKSTLLRIEAKLDSLSALTQQIHSRLDDQLEHP